LAIKNVTIYDGGKWLGLAIKNISN